MDPDNSDVEALTLAAAAQATPSAAVVVSTFNNGLWTALPAPTDSASISSITSSIVSNSNSDSSSSMSSSSASSSSSTSSPTSTNMPPPHSSGGFKFHIAWLIPVFVLFGLLFVIAVGGKIWGRIAFAKERSLKRQQRLIAQRQASMKRSEIEEKGWGQYSEAATTLRGDESLEMQRKYAEFDAVEDDDAAEEEDEKKDQFQLYDAPVPYDDGSETESEHELKGPLSALGKHLAGQKNSRALPPAARMEMERYGNMVKANSWWSVQWNRHFGENEGGGGGGGAGGGRYEGIVGGGSDELKRQRSKKAASDWLQRQQNVINSSQSFDPVNPIQAQAQSQREGNAWSRLKHSIGWGYDGSSPALDNDRTNRIHALVIPPQPPTLWSRVPLEEEEEEDDENENEYDWQRRRSTTTRSHSPVQLYDGPVSYPQPVINSTTLNRSLPPTPFTPFTPPIGTPLHEVQANKLIRARTMKATNGSEVSNSESKAKRSQTVKIDRHSSIKGGNSIKRARTIKSEISEPKSTQRSQTVKIQKRSSLSNSSDHNPAKRSKSLRFSEDAVEEIGEITGKRKIKALEEEYITQRIAEDKNVPQRIAEDRRDSAPSTNFSPDMRAMDDLEGEIDSVLLSVIARSNTSKSYARSVGGFASVAPSPKLMRTPTKKMKIDDTPNTPQTPMTPNTMARTGTWYKKDGRWVRTSPSTGREQITSLQNTPIAAKTARMEVKMPSSLPRALLAGSPERKTIDLPDAKRADSIISSNSSGTSKPTQQYGIGDSRGNLRPELGNKRNSVHSQINQNDLFFTSNQSLLSKNSSIKSKATSSVLSEEMDEDQPSPISPQRRTALAKRRRSPNRRYTAKLASGEDEEEFEEDDGERDEVDSIINAYNGIYTPKQDDQSDINMEEEEEEGTEKSSSFRLHTGKSLRTPAEKRRERQYAMDRVQSIVTRAHAARLQKTPPELWLEKDL